MFLDDLQEDPELRQQVLLYKSGHNNMDIDDDEEEDYPGVRMDELLDEMNEMTLE